MSLNREVELGCKPAKQVYNVVPECFASRIGWKSLSPCFPSQALIRLVKIQISVIREGVLESHLIATAAAFDKFADGAAIIVKGLRLHAEPL